MRWVLAAVVVLAVAPSAFADDFGILRGTQPTYRWSGIYGGGQVGYSSSVVNFGQAASSDIGFILRNTAIQQDQQISQWSVLGSRSPVTTGVGAFIGYNIEWENLITGLEVNYNHVSLSASSGSTITRSFTESANLPAGHHYFYSLTVTGQSALHMSDIATFRLRGGVEEGSFLPYVFGGLAVARADFSNSATLSFTATDFPDSSTPPLTPLPTLNFGPVTQGNTQSGSFAYGFATGAGVDVGLTPNVFVRGEFEYIYFAPLNGIHVTTATGRVGGGLKF